MELRRAASPVMPNSGGDSVANEALRIQVVGAPFVNANNLPTSNNSDANKDQANNATVESDGLISPEATATSMAASKKRALSPSAKGKSSTSSSSSDGFTSPTSTSCSPSSSSSPSSAGTVAPHIDPHDLTLLKVIGRGTFAQQVALARHRATQNVYVIKTLDKQQLIQRKQVRHTLTEKRVLETIGGNHPFIVKLISSFQTDTDLNFVLEYCQGGELFYHLQQQQQQQFSEVATVFYAGEVLSALQELHSHGIVYRDLKPENVLLDAQGHVKLADFGFAKEDMTEGQRTYSFCGSPEYLSPEMVHKDGHGVETDMWSFGCFIYELLTGAPPFQSGNLRRLFDLIQEGRVWYPPHLSSSAISLLQGLLRVNPRSRLTASQAMEHPFFKSLDWDELLQRQVTPPIVPVCSSHECTQNFDDGFTSECVKSLGLDSLSMNPADCDDWSKRQRQDQAQDVFGGF